MRPGVLGDAADANASGALPPPPEHGSGTLSGFMPDNAPGDASGESSEEDAPDGGAYPMDYYAADGGDWGSTYMKKRAPRKKKEGARAPAPAAW